MMNDSWQTILQRQQQTNAVWTQHSPTFTVGGLTPAAHAADGALLEPRAQAVVTAEDAVDTARNARDAAVALITDLAIRAPRKMDGELAVRDPFHADLKHIRVVEITGLETAVTRGQRTLSLWEKLNARNAAAVPVLPPLLVGGKTVADLAAALAGLPALTQAVENQTSALNDRRSELQALKERVYSNNIRWYAAWEGEFLPGSPERAALSQIDTGSDTPQPKALEIDSLAAVDATTVQVNYAAEGGDHATTMLLYYYVVGQPEWGKSVAIQRPSQQVSDVDFEQGLVRFRTTTANSTGEADSAAKEIQL
jgi:hypothetical protein